MYAFDYDEMQLQIKDTAKKFAEEEILPGVIERDVKAEFPREILTKLGELGFLGMMVPTQWGGSGLDTISYTLAIEEIAKVEAAVTIVLSVQNSLVNWLLDHYGNDEQKEKYLRPLAEGKKIGAFCLSEPEAGSDATKQHTTAVKQGDSWILNGMKNWISTGINSDLFIVFAQNNRELRHKGISCFVIEKGTPGFESGIPENKMGMRSSDTCSISLTNVKVPESQMIGEPGMGFKIAMKSLNGGRIGIAAQAVGIAQGAFEHSMKYARQRFAFGKPIFEHQMIQQKLAQMVTKIDAARLLTHKAAYLKDTNQDIVLASAEAKLFASAVANEVTRDAVQIHGGYGYVREYHVERMMRDAKVTEIYEGTSEVQQIVILRELMKLY